MKMLTAEDVAGYLQSSGVSPHQAARNDLIVEIRQTVQDAIEAGDAPEGTPLAATFTLEELRERGIESKSGKSSGLKASRNGNGPIARVATLDETTVLVVLNETWLAEHPGFPDDEDAEDTE